MKNLYEVGKDLSRARLFIAKLTMTKKYKVEAREALRKLDEVRDVINTLQTIFMPDADEE